MLPQRRLRAALAAGLLVALGLGALRAPAPAAADVIPPGQKAVGYGCQIANLAAYPDYLVIGLGVNPALGPYQVLQAGDCAPFYKLSTVVFYAVRRDAFDPGAVPPFQSGGGTSSPQQAYFASHAQFLPAALQVRRLNDVDQRDPRQGVVDILEIAALTDMAFDLRLARVRYTYTDGSSEELPAAPDGTRPAPRAGGAAPGPTPVLVPDAPNGGSGVVPAAPGGRFALLWFAALPALAALGLAALAWRRRR